MGIRAELETFRSQRIKPFAERVSTAAKVLEESALYRREPLHYGLASRPTRKIAEKLAGLADKGISPGIIPDAITTVGFITGSIGQAFLAEPSFYAEKIAQVTKGRISLSEMQVKALGYPLWGIAMLCDIEDGAVVGILQDRGLIKDRQSGPIKDALPDKFVENAGAISILFAPAESKWEKSAWRWVPAASTWASIARSDGIAHGIPFGKVSLGSRPSVEAILVSGHAIEWLRGRGKGWQGGILMGARLIDIGLRHWRIHQSQDKEAIQQLYKDFADYWGSVIALHAADMPSEAFIYGLGKLADVKCEEAYGERLSTKLGNKLQSHEIFRRTS